MDTIKRRFLLMILKALNLGLMSLSFAASTVLLYARNNDSVGFSDFLSMRISLRNFVIGILILWSWHLAFAVLNLYHSKRLARLHSLIVDTAKATTLASICFAVIAKACHIRIGTPKFTLVFWALSTVLLVSARFGVWYALRIIRRHGRNLRHVLIVGTNPRAFAFADRLASTRELGYHMLGFVDDRRPGFERIRGTQYPLCCDVDGLAAFLRQNVVDEVAVYLPMKSLYERAAQVVALCEEHGIAVRFDADLFNLKIARFPVVSLEGRSQVAVQVCSPGGWAGIAKRIMDIVLSSLLLALFAPLFAVVAILIKASSKGPVFFLQERIGLNKRRFRIYKFRTMVTDAEKMLPELERLNEVSGPVFKIKRDPRLTPVGGFLRRTSIDELPQLLNVLKGDMSLVGPRPLPVRDYQGFNEDWQRRRFSIRPGITCLWQINGRSSISFDQWMKLDLRYIDEWSLWLDLKILARTLPAVLRGTGAA
jgi:exopolysaccharide biosynthesis polyprenyl glycosylphosphotransferase